MDVKLCIKNIKLIFLCVRRNDQLYIQYNYKIFAHIGGAFLLTILESFNEQNFLRVCVYTLSALLKIHSLQAEKCQDIFIVIYLATVRLVWIIFPPIINVIIIWKLFFCIYLCYLRYHFLGGLFLSFFLITQILGQDI